MSERIMKDSGIEWIGSIPNNWKLLRLKNILKERNEKNDPIITENILSLGLNYGVIPYSEREISGGNKAKDDLTQYKIVRPNDIVMNSMNVISGSVGKSNYFGCASPVYYMFYPRTEEFDINYYNMIFQSKAFQRSLLGLGNGIMMKENDEGNFNTVRMRIPLIKLNNVILPIPSKEEQTKISNFLDTKIYQVDNAISKTKESIEEYKKLKQSIITEAVTKGLNPDVEMKDSGNVHIGECPKHWEVKRFKYIVESLFKGNGISKEEVYENGNINCVRYGEIYSKYNEDFDECYSKTKIDDTKAQVHISEGDILFSGTGELIEEIGKNVVYMGKEDCLAGGDIIVCKHKQNPIFLNYSLNSSYSQEQKSKGKAKLKVVHISASEIGNITVPLPPRKEQDEIANYLKKKSVEISKIILSKEKLIKELEQYKKSLIYEYVTGKKEVN